MRIVAEGPGRHTLAEAPNDVCCCVKRYFADDNLSQEPSTLLNRFPFEEPVLVFPATFLRLLADIPVVARPFKTLDQDRRKKLLQLADLLLKSNSFTSTGRTVQYLLGLCDVNACPGPLADLDWLREGAPDPFDALAHVNFGSKPLGAVIPQMRFQAWFRRAR